MYYLFYIIHISYEFVIVFRAMKVESIKNAKSDIAFVLQSRSILLSVLIYFLLLFLIQSKKTVKF